MEATAKHARELEIPRVAVIYHTSSELLLFPGGLWGTLFGLGSRARLGYRDAATEVERWTDRAIPQTRGYAGILHSGQHRGALPILLQ